MLRPLRFLALLIATLMVVAGGTVAGEPQYEQAEQTLYAEWVGCGAGAELFLTVVQPTTFNGCGTIGGAPLNTVNNVQGSPALRTFPTRTGDGVPVLLDATEQLTGEASVYSWTGATGAGVGAVIVEATVHGRVDNQTVTFGTAEETFVATPTEDHLTLDFAFDIDEELNLGSLTSLTLDLNIWGAFADAGIVATGGLTSVTVPILIEVETG